MVTLEHSEIRKIKEYAKINKVPIMQDEGIEYLTTFIVKHQIKKILEVGTAIGYSAIQMALVHDDIEITTIERDEERYLQALKNVKKFGLEKRITLIFKDALEVSLNEEYDLIFLDAAKGQNIRFFENFDRNLKKEGYMITDNMNFHGLVFKEMESIKSKNLRSLVRKIKEYHTFLEENENYTVEFLDLGDGLAVAKKSRWY